MRTVQEIYDAYRIMPSLQLHMLRVTGAAKLLCDSFLRDVAEHEILVACLFHDMGNIIKSELTVFPEFTEPEGLAHWQLVKEEFISKYGADSHAANVTIARELRLPEASVRLIDGISFSGIEKTKDGDSYEQKIVEYCDLRVGPHGVLSLAGRIEEGKSRFVSKHPGQHRDENEWEKIVLAAHEIERQLFLESDITPEDISEEAVRPLFDALRAYSPEL